MGYHTPRPPAHAGLQDSHSALPAGVVNNPDSEAMQGADGGANKGESDPSPANELSKIIQINLHRRDVI